MTKPAAADEAQQQKAMGLLMGNLNGATQTQVLSVGLKAGMVQPFYDGNARTAAELAADSGCGARHCREFLLALAAGGLFTTDAAAEKFTLLPGVRDMLEGPLHGFTELVAANGGTTIDAVVASTKKGVGLGYDVYPNFSEHMGMVSRLDAATKHVPRMHECGVAP
eukprot:CAMPEP_0198332770 /NCGR_PEP_ID=MMETSP1450-20131203/18500_1 /TAXON_ID=753684 ORGANISM="Madagascaria erythrocladiodes, Strain CCMP3234" /NCGR_SAMPLE_ID=MMETSP1450 /ASSEMBLY_ACC=CAM_ASM_001115 /LENGTH=165 /DNA_ID=CAMNT_0044037239 /DNA_START=40 /DNA_END=533 /DNA_ORIENTATION=-